MNRRGFITGSIGIIVSPAIVKASSLMPVRSWQTIDVEAELERILREEIRKEQIGFITAVVARELPKLNPGFKAWLDSANLATISPHLKRRRAAEAALPYSVGDRILFRGC